MLATCICLALTAFCALGCWEVLGAEAAAQAAEGKPDTEPAGGAPACFDFEGTELPAGWFNIAHEGSLRITNEPADVREGRGALEFTYTPREGKLALLGVTPVKAEGRARSLSFSIKTEEPSALLYGVNEADRSSYQAYLYSPGGQWHDVRVDLDELMLSEDSTDEDTRLDVDEVDTIIVADLCNLPGEVGRSLGIKQGVQRMWLDNVALTQDMAPHRSCSRAEGNGAIIVDDFDHDEIVSLPIGGPQLTLVPGPEADGDSRALEVRYRLGGHRWAGFVRALGYLELSGTSELRIMLKADHRARLTVVLEERDGSKYSSDVELRPEDGWHEVGLPIEQFVPDPNTKDENAQLDLGQLRVVIMVVDTFNASVDANGLGAYTISRIRFR